VVVFVDVEVLAGASAEIAAATRTPSANRMRRGTNRKVGRTPSAASSSEHQHHHLERLVVASSQRSHCTHILNRP
jgi:hypothetical protein